jgi:hypothetical protein
MRRLNSIGGQVEAPWRSVARVSATFTKADDQLIELGLPVRMVMLYGKLEFMCGARGECWGTHAMLAKKIGLRGRRQIIYLLEKLHLLKLIDWKRERYFCRFRVLKPDVRWIAHLRCATECT